MSYYLSIEHGRWFAHEKMKHQVANTPYAARICYTHADCGFSETPNGHGEFNDARANKRPSPSGYYGPYFASLPDGKKFSRFLVDGRVRPQLAAMCLMHMDTPSDSIVFVHDWERGYYQQWTLKLFDILSKQKRITALRPKPDAVSRLQALLAARPGFWR